MKVANTCHACVKPMGTRVKMPLLCGLDGGDDLVHDLAVGGGAGQVVVDKHGEDDSAAAGGVKVAGECAGLAESSGFGEDVVFEGRVGEAVDQRAVLAADGERGFPGGEPRLGGGEGAEFGDGARGDQVVAA